MTRQLHLDLAHVRVRRDEAGDDHVCGKAALIEYDWIEKTITAIAVTLGFAER